MSAPVGHLSTEAFAHRTGINVVHVPYKGGVSQYTIELMSGYIDFASLQIFNVAPFVKQGKLARHRRQLPVRVRPRCPRSKPCTRRASPILKTTTGTPC